MTARQQQRPPLAFCSTCNARERAIVAGRCIVCGNPPKDEARRCSCAHNSDGSVTTMLCPTHADQDPCLRMSQVTGRRRRGSIVKGVCSVCGWEAVR